MEKKEIKSLLGVGTVSGPMAHLVAVEALQRSGALVTPVGRQGPLPPLPEGNGAKRES